MTSPLFSSDLPARGPPRKKRRLEVTPPASTSNAALAPPVASTSASGSTSTTNRRPRERDYLRARSETPEPPPKNFDEVRFGDHVIDVEFFSPYPDEVGRDAPDEIKPPTSSTPITANGATQPAADAPARKRRIWVCDKCFAYTRKHERWAYHAKTCQLEFPPGRMVYKRAQVTIWEVDSSDPKAKAFCANLSLFGKLFIDHKTIFYDVTDFLFYVVAEAWPNRDVIYGYFSKEKHDVNDHNVACIMVFPPFQSGGWGRLLMEFSYWLTRNAASPGGPEHPLSAAGKRGYESYWCKVVLRAAINMLVEPPTDRADLTDEQLELYAWMKGVLDKKRKPPYPVIEAVDFNDPPGDLAILPERRLTLADLAKRAHIKVDDARTALTLMGFLRTPLQASRQLVMEPGASEDAGRSERDRWAELAEGEVVMPTDIVLKACEVYGVRTQGVLDEQFCL